jgi:ribosomal protein S18 acetylase RimI-like enzyme
MTTTLLRPASTDDLDLLVGVMIDASTSHLSRSVWHHVLGLDDHQVAQVLGAVATSEHPHWCHVDRFRILEVDGVPAAAASSFDVATEGNEALFVAAADVLAQAGATEAETQAALARAALVDAVTPAPYPDAWGIENVAVDPRFRGQGLVGHLLEAAAADARARHRPHVQIMCLDGNERAQRAWERAGFVVRAERADAGFADLVGARGMKLLTREP